MKIVIINGKPTSGKDTFVNMCKLIDPKIQNYSTVDGVKDVARKMGWNEDKSEKGRKLLSDLKDLWDNYNHGATNNTIKRAMHYSDLLDELGMDSAVFIHCREPEKIAEMKASFEESGYSVVTLLIKRSSVESVESNHSDRDVENYNYDVAISNDGTLDDLIASSRWFYYTILVGDNPTYEQE